MDKLFETALREKYRYPDEKGISTEALWDLSDSQLDQLFKTLNRQLKAAREEDSLLSTTSDTEADERKIAVIRRIAEIRREEHKRRGFFGWIRSLFSK
ncbi:MAG: hypothetical protein IIW34_06220 [Clostridia bacterium]|nr:hypothetical protein [Clostridia bacterium]